MKQPRRRAAGFTLVELMVSILLTSVVLLAVYFVFITNARQYYLQEQVVQMQESLRFAMEFIKNDLRNAGKNTVISADPNSWNNPEANIFCRPRAGLSAVRLFDGDEEAPPFLNGGEPFNPDRLRLLSDVSAGTPLKTVRINGDQIVIAPDLQQATFAAREVMSSEARFNALYEPGRYLQVSTLQANPPMVDLLEIVNVDFGGPGEPATITVAENNPLKGGPCIQDVLCAGDCMVNPVAVVEYALVADPDVATKSDLIRREMEVVGGVTRPRAGRSLVIADYVVNLQFWGLYDIRNPGSAIPNIPEDADPTDDIGNWLDDEEEAMNLRTHRVRGIHVLLGARTSREDPQFALALEDQKMADRNWFDVIADPGPQDRFARVATLSSMVETPNILKPFGWGAP